MPNSFLTSVPQPLRTQETDQFTAYWSNRRDRLIEAITKIINFQGDYNQFSDFYLNDLAAFFGFSSENFWSDDWSKTTKGMLFKGVYNDPYIWRNQFSFNVLEYIFKCFGLKAGITSKNGFIAGQGIVNITTLGEDTVYSIYYQENSSIDRILIEKILDEFFPLGVEKDIVKI